uniref:Uncharacterized protein n=1 Tax=Rhizophora mucronata TaxID=61149 RepID=A0A2P2P1E0_RHIMU
MLLSESIFFSSSQL